jgi:ATP-dependent DNA helicase RecG
VLIGQALRELDSASVRDWLPPALLAPLGLPPLRDALRHVHRPPVDADLEELEAGRHPAQRRLAFEELLTHQVVMRRLRESVRTDPAWPLDDSAGLEAAFLAQLPYTLTAAQRRALDEIDADLAGARPMVRLVQGDVGCGKTVVAAAAAARAAGSGRPAVLMAPTELLAEQHQRNLDAWFRPLGVTVALVSGSQPARTRRSALAAVASGEVQIAVGTHALFQEGVRFHDLALVIVDEQHRFGVQQRLRLAEKGEAAGR